MYSSTHSLTSALDGSEWSASRPGRFTHMERVPEIHWIGGWVGHRAVLVAVVKRKIPSPRRDSNPRKKTVTEQSLGNLRRGREIRMSGTFGICVMRLGVSCSSRRIVSAVSKFRVQSSVCQSDGRPCVCIFGHAQFSVYASLPLDFLAATCNLHIYISRCL
jgi:hypothetical protein